MIVVLDIPNFSNLSFIKIISLFIAPQTLFSLSDKSLIYPIIKLFLFL